MELVTVETAYGTVAGTREADDLVVFRGIPYAAPPVGDLRFRPPTRPEPWSGAREATEFAPMGLQPPPDAMGSIPGDPDEQSEDCLYLNVYTPACDDGSRPVMVWIHGGGFVSGSSSSALYAGDRLARLGVVLVTVNYRLGALGWLGHPALADAANPQVGFANWGLQDQIAALEWVSEHAAAFGGDPRRVTVFGESAGGISVAALLATSAPQRLFHRAIIQSGAAIALGQGSATQVAADLAAELGLGPEQLSRQTLVALPADELLRAQIALGPKYEALGLAFQPVIDGGVLSRHPAAAIAGGSATGIELLVGTNRDEWRFWELNDPSLRELDEARLHRLVRRHADEAGLSGLLDPAEMVETYRKARESRGDSVSPTDLHCAMASDWTFRVPSMRLATGHDGGLGRVFTYLFDWESPFGGGVLGSCHALELPFVFGSCSHPAISLFSGGGEAAERLSETMRRAWVSFAASGSPAGDGVGPWPEYDSARRATKRLGPIVEVIEAPMEDERAVLDFALGPYGELEATNAERVRVPGRVARG
ncbi:MAG: carboxylesterase/lipase family protein [Acidimicrobiales bacterium]